MAPSTYSSNHSINSMLNEFMKKQIEERNQRKGTVLEDLLKTEAIQDTAIP